MKRRLKRMQQRRMKAYLVRGLVAAAVLLMLFLCVLGIRGVIRLIRSKAETSEGAAQMRISAGSGAPHEDRTPENTGEDGAVTAPSSEEALQDELFGTAQERILEIKKNGSVIETLTDSFDVGEYDEEGFRAMVDEEIEEYNAGTPGGVALKKLQFSDGRVTLVREYASARDYALVNSLSFRVGSTKDIGTVNTALTKLSDGSSVPASEIGSLKGTAVVLNFAATLKVPKKITYASRPVTVTAKKEAKTARTAENAVLIY